MKAWTFYRRSTNLQELSILDQRKACRDFAERQGWQIAREFEPLKGYASGLTIDQDPTFQEMVRAAEIGGHGVSKLIVYDVSRFGRLAPESKIYWEQRFKRHAGMEIHYVKDDFKNDGSIGDVISKVVKHSEAHEYSLKLSQSTLRGAKSHAELGHSSGGRAPYGFDRLLIDAQGQPVKILKAGEHKADKLQRITWKPSPITRKTVRDIFKAYASGVGLNLIVNGLNQKGTTSPTGKTWNKGQVRAMLRNRAYIGTRIYNKTSYKGYRRGERGSLLNSPSEWITKENAHPTIVERDLFESVQAKISIRTEGEGKTRGIGRGRPYGSPYLLSGLARCGKCDYAMTGGTKTGNGHQYRNYTCSGYWRIGKGVCESFNVRASELEGLALQTIRDEIKNPKWKDELKPTLSELIRNRFGEGSKGELEAIKAKLKDLGLKIQNIVAAISRGHYSPALGLELEKLEREKAAVGQELSNLEAKPTLEHGVDGMVDEMMGLAGEFDELWKDCASSEEKKEFLKAFIYRVTVNPSPEGISATYYLFKFPHIETKRARNLPFQIPDPLSLKLIAGVGFEPTTSRL
jgi:DNA invertase Pin-like site-specific DNA recombinase